MCVIVALFGSSMASKTFIVGFAFLVASRAAAMLRDVNEQHLLLDKVLHVCEGSSADAWARRVYRKDMALEETETPYGPLVKTMHLPLEVELGAEPTTMSLKYVCPFALLWESCQECPGFLSFLAEHVCMSTDAFKRSSYWDEATPGAKPPARVVLYEDSVTPGNVRRHDKGRSYLAVYWTFLDLPSWFTSSLHGWFTLAFVAETKVVQIAGKDSQLTRMILKAFFSSGMDFSKDGCALAAGAEPGRAEPGKAKPPWFWFRSVFCCFLTDADGHHKITMCKGASGTHVCASCDNVMGRCSPQDIPPGSPLVHFTCGDMTKIRGLSPQKLAAYMAHLRTQKAILGKTAFKELEQQVGWTFSEYSLVCSDMAAIANVPDSIFWDWQHTVCSSGGVAQYELNGYLRGVKRLNPQLLETMDQFAKQVVLPTCHRNKLQKLSFQARMHDKDGEHIKGFASEVLTLMVIVCLWAELIMVPALAMPEETKCLLLMGRILYMLQSGRAVLSRLPLLQQLILEHHALFVRLYPDGAKPKVHFLLHIPLLFDRFKANLSCFVTERKHKQSKRYGAFCVNMMCDTMLRKSLQEHFTQFQRPGCFDEVYWRDGEGLSLARSKKYILKWHDTLVAAKLVPGGDPLAGAKPAFEVGHHIRSPVGTMSRQDLVLFRDPRGSTHAGFVEIFFRTPGAQPTFYAIVQKLSDLAGCQCSEAAHHLSYACVHAGAWAGTFPYFCDGDVVRIVASADNL